MEVVFLGHLVAKVFHGLAAELDQLVAYLAVQVIVAGVSVVVLEHAAAAEGHFFQEARFDQFTKSSIDGRPADLPFGDQILKMLHQLVGVEVVVMAEDLLDDNPPLSSYSLASRLQKLREALQRRQGRRDGTEREVVRHGNEADPKE